MDVRSIIESEIVERLERLRNVIETKGLDGVLIGQLTDLYYFSNTDQDAQLWVPASHDPILMVRKSITRAILDSPIKKVMPLKGFQHLKDVVIGSAGRMPKKIGLEMDTLPASFLVAYQKLFPDTEMVDIAPSILGIRMVKSEYEIGCIQTAAKTADSLFNKMGEFLSEGERELDVAMKIESYLSSQGCPPIVRLRGYNFEGRLMFVISGKSASTANSAPSAIGGVGPGAFYSQGPGYKRINRNEPVVVDVAVCSDGYLSDQTRVFSLGVISDDLMRAHDTMLEVQTAVTDRAVPGTKVGDLYDLAVEIVKRSGIQKGFMGLPDSVPFIGHGVGLELDEWPVLGKNQKAVLEQGMTIALEPKIVILNQGGVGIENTYLTGPSGMERLNRFPDEICNL